MMGIFGQASNALRYRPRAASVEDKPIEDSEPDDTSVLLVPYPFFFSPPLTLPCLVTLPLLLFVVELTFKMHDTDDEFRDEQEGSIILSLISQLR